jgi:hypothetical protein
VTEKGTARGDGERKRSIDCTLRRCSVFANGNSLPHSDSKSSGVIWVRSYTSMSPAAG